MYLVLRHLSGYRAINTDYESTGTSLYLYSHRELFTIRWRNVNGRTYVCMTRTVTRKHFVTSDDLKFIGVDDQVTVSESVRAMFVTATRTHTTVCSSLLMIWWELKHCIHCVVHCCVNWQLLATTDRRGIEGLNSECCQRWTTVPLQTVDWRIPAYDDTYTRDALLTCTASKASTLLTDHEWWVHVLFFVHFHGEFGVFLP